MALITHTLYPDHIALTSRTSSDWTALNPVLLKGEIGIESDTLRMKIGNGNSAWNALAYPDEVTRTVIENLTQRVEYLEELAVAIIEVVSGVMDNIMRGEVNT